RGSRQTTGNASIVLRFCAPGFGLRLLHHRLDARRRVRLAPLANGSLATSLRDFSVLLAGPLQTFGRTERTAGDASLQRTTRGANYKKFPPREKKARSEIGAS